MRRLTVAVVVLIFIGLLGTPAVGATGATPGGIISASHLNAVACTSATACTAVGYTLTFMRPDTPETVVTMVELWDGTKWTIQPTPNPASLYGNILTGVACTSATACTAVGQTVTRSGRQVTLALRWNGTKWTIQPTPKRGGSIESVLNGVACASATACTAVGSTVTRSGRQVTLALRWNGTKWRIQPTPNPAGSSRSGLSAVACTSARACTAVGGSAGNTLAERWDGTKWTIQPTPKRGGSLYDVACTSATACTAVGGSDRSALAERWNGTKWTIQPTPSPAGRYGSGLFAVSCTSAMACTAVGYSTSSAGPFFTLAERWDGTKWTIQPTPNPGAGGSDLLGVACASATACTAVGSYTSGGTLAERWDGTKWTVQPTPNPAGSAGNVLNGVACASATACYGRGVL